MTRRSSFHIVVVEPYEGLIEPPATDEPRGREGARGLGLPLEALAERIDATVTVLDWDPWLELERRGRLFTTWTPVPATRAVLPPDPAPRLSAASDRVRIRSIPTTDPGDGRELGLRKPSLRGFGILADNDPLVYLGCRLARELDVIHRREPIHLVIAPAWGGLACLAQLERATGLPGAIDARIAIVTTDSSARRQGVNQEGLWSREAASRRQMESLSIGLADAVLAFGPRGEALAAEGRLPEAPSVVRVPRRVPEDRVDAIERAAQRRTVSDGPPSLFFHGSLEPATGALVTLDAVVEIARDRGRVPGSPVACTGPDTTFAPMAPRTFRDYWSSRAFAREVEDTGWWRWGRPEPGIEGSTVLRLRPAPWGHLPDAWSDLARRSMVLLSPAEAEGLAPEGCIPELFLLDGEPEAAGLAEAMTRILGTDPVELERARAELCAAVARARRCGTVEREIALAARSLRALCEKAPPPQPLDRVSRLLLDRRRSLRDIDLGRPPTAIPAPAAGTVPGSLSVIVPCHEMGMLVRETVESVWNSDRIPDELIVVDDGSRDRITHAVLAELEEEALRRQLPLAVLTQRNRGLAGARNAGLEIARGEFISFLDGDDLIEPSFFRLALQLLQGEPGLGGVAAWSVIFDEKGTTGHWNAPQPELPLQFVENCVFVPLMMRTALLRAIGGIDERQRYNYEDWEMSCRLLVEGWPIVTIPAYLQRYRVREDSLYRSMTPVQNQVMEEAMLERHRPAVERFSVEVAMMVKNRLARQRHASENGRLPSATAAPAKWIRKGGAATGLAWRWATRAVHRAREARP